MKFYLSLTAVTAAGIGAFAYFDPASAYIFYRAIRHFFAQIIPLAVVALLIMATVRVFWIEHFTNSEVDE